MAERKGFEPLALDESLVFKTSSINRSDTSPFLGTCNIIACFGAAVNPRVSSFLLESDVYFPVSPAQTGVAGQNGQHASIQQHWIVEELFPNELGLRFIRNSQG